MPQITGSIQITGHISPTDTTDTYSTHLSWYGRGGLKAIDTLADTGSITADRN